MSVAIAGVLHGNVINLDEPAPQFDGKRLRVILEPYTDEELGLGSDMQQQLWQEWAKGGPQGPIVDEGEPDFP